MPALIETVDAILNDPRWAPRRGWHDDHRERDRTPEYLPAMMQVRAEFAEFIDELQCLGALGGRCLQLGMGECDASHAVWRALFRSVMTVDWRIVALDSTSHPGANTRDREIHDAARAVGPFDMLFVDAGHKLEDISRDHAEYGPMVRPGGVIAFHDALKRPGFEDEVDVWRYLETLKQPVTRIGSEVGIAYILR